MHLIKQITINNLFLPANRFPIISAILCFPLDCTLIGGLSMALLLVSLVSVKQTDGDFPIHLTKKSVLTFNMRVGGKYLMLY